MMHNQLTFHLFGNCFIETPTAEEVEKFSQYLPLLKILEQSPKTRANVAWDFGPASQELIERDTAEWRRLGVNRSPYFVQPSGSIQSPLALHLFNPTFYVADSRSVVTDDPTNPTIQLLHQCGLKSSHCFMFDQICRREETLECLHFYTEDMRQNHRDFVRKLRDHMSAVVEICFGEQVFKELHKTTRLVRVPLWGKYKPVRLWLELDESNSPIRLMIQAYHPQFFFRPGRFSKTSAEFSETFGRAQDLAISMAIQLAKLPGSTTPDKTFWGNLVRGQYSRLTGKQDSARREHIQEALDVFRVAFPSKFKAYEQRQTRRKEETDLFQQLDFTPQHMQTYSTHSLSKKAQESRLRERNSKLHDTVTSFQKVIQDMNLFHDEANDDDHVEPEVFAIEHETFEDIPTPLRSWLQGQDGLKIRGVSLTNRQTLERTFSLLDNGITTRLERFSIHYIARMVGILYVRKITRISRIKEAKAIPGEPGVVIHRECSCCGQYVLDDAFPFYLLQSPSHYLIEVVAREGANGCGHKQCHGKPNLHPIDPAQKYVRAEHRAIEKAMRQQERDEKDWKATLCRIGRDLEGCAKVVRVCCSACGQERNYDTPQWTIHSPPRLVKPRLSCAHEQKARYFKPVDSRIVTICVANLRKIHNQFRNAGYDLANYPKIPEIIFSERESIQKKIQRLEKASLQMGEKR